MTTYHQNDGSHGASESDTTSRATVICEPQLSRKALASRLVHLGKWTCCALCAVWLALSALAAFFCMTSQMSPDTKAEFAVVTVAAVIPVLLLLNGRVKYMLGLPCLFAAAWILCAIWETRNETGVRYRSRQRTAVRMSEIGLALRLYSDHYGHLPFPVRRASSENSATWPDANGDGPPLYSWRVEILPVQHSGNPPESWDAPANVERLMPWMLFSHGLSPEAEITPGEKFPHAMALAITGPGTAFGDGSVVPAALDKIPPETIIVVEASQSGIQWPAPGDLDIRNMSRSINVNGGNGLAGFAPTPFDTFYVLFADGEVRRLSKEVPFETLEKFFTTANSENRGREQLLAPYTVERLIGTPGAPYVWGNKWDWRIY